MKFREAELTDLSQIVAMITDDPLGMKRENYQIPLPQYYIDAFNEISADNNQQLMIVLNGEEEIIGTFQLSFLRYITYKGGLRAQIEGVRVKKEYRGSGVGKKIFEWAITQAKDKGAHLLQLTTDKKRPNAISFYKKLGFIDSHEGMKIHFDMTLLTDLPKGDRN
jgi:GNAT superfamily N-acetyltransferase